MARISVGDAWDTLMDLGVSDETLQIITRLNGYSPETLEDVLFAHTGYRSFDQLECPLCGGDGVDDDGDNCPECYE